MAKVKLGWSLLSISQKIVKANSVRITMADNADVYPNPEPTLLELDDAVGALAVAQSQAIKGGTDRTVVRNKRLNELTEIMVRLVDYVQLTSGGDPELIIKSGMEVKSEGAPWPLPFKVPNLEARPGGNPGTILLTWDAAKYKKSYVVEIWMADGNAAPANPASPGATSSGSWQVLVIQGKREYEAIGLTTGSIYRFRVAAQNSAGLGPYSDETQSVAR